MRIGTSPSKIDSTSGATRMVHLPRLALGGTPYPGRKRLMHNLRNRRTSYPSPAASSTRDAVSAGDPNPERSALGGGRPGLVVPLIRLTGQAERPLPDHV